ncbi:Plant-specific domain TIGR01615 family protein [Zea mays]|uniref:Plant-specific domain TIGR01615 family protein n=1 Tax=Zea mays TaxID=4577 RepID=A0A1D6F943_MAIZE|nr:Plant-specific domain TIGR01615 family protein [Zea mays]
MTFLFPAKNQQGTMEGRPSAPARVSMFRRHSWRRRRRGGQEGHGHGVADADAVACGRARGG